MSDSNNDPLRNRYAASDTVVEKITARDETQISFATDTSHAYGIATYLGAIYSEDRQTIYWVNETRPLPN